MVNEVDMATMKVSAEKKTPRRGTASEVVGVISESIVRKKHTESRMVVSENTD